MKFKCLKRMPFDTGTEKLVLNPNDEIELDYDITRISTNFIRLDEPKKETVITKRMVTPRIVKVKK